MPTLSDFLLNTSAAVVGSFVRAVNNVTGVAYVSTGATPASGQFTINAPAGMYTLSTGPTAGGPWTATGDTAYEINNPYNDVGIYNVIDYGAKGDGVTDDGAAIRAALDACNTAGGGTVFFPAGTYMTGLVAHPENAAYVAGLIVGGSTNIVGAGRGATVVKLLPNLAIGNDLANNNMMLLNRGLGGADVRITITDITFDGNGGNQTHNQGGVTFIRTRSVRLTRVRCTNFRGTASSGVNETFFFETQLSTDTSFTDCEAIVTAGSSSSGFSADGATNVKYVNCLAYGMTVANGFTHNGCRNIQHTNCHSYLNAGIGFNSEVSQVITYANCIGGSSASTGPSWPYASAITLGNTSSGFTCNGSTQVQYVGCQSRQNGGDGLTLVAPAAHVRIVGGDYSSNTNYGIAWQSNTMIGTCFITAKPAMTGNGISQIAVIGGVGNSAVEGVLNAPAVPGTGVDFTNPFPFRVMIFISAGTISANGVRYDGVNLGTPPLGGTYLLEPGHTIGINYTVAPAWVWIGMV